jgi:outer membrane lipoprotein-sorting protein
MKMTTKLLSALSLPSLIAACFFLAPPANAQNEDPWALLQRVRQSLVDAGPTGAAFVQTYIPAGFSSGEKETGRLALALPDCLRWDYQDPYPKSFLLCGGIAHSWNPEDRTGRRYRVNRKTEPGLDLLLLGVDDLRGRYQASTQALDGGRVQVSLNPKEKMAELADATMTVDAASRRVVAVSYHDREGNLTRFEIQGYRDLPRQGQFSPPSGIKWED